MNTFLWIVQILFALHTAMGAIWKFTNPIQTSAPSLAAMPQGLWILLGVLELAAAAGLVLPLFNKDWAFMIPVAAVFIAAEMVLFGILHFASGHAYNFQVSYWIVVAIVGAFVAWARLSWKPLA
jgi:hypothetical protein